MKIDIEKTLLNKIQDLPSLKGVVTHWQKEGKKVVFTNGVFDLLHIGHITYLAKASELGDKLIIGLNADSSVKRIKGEDRPVNDQNNRGRRAPRPRQCGPRRVDLPLLLFHHPRGQAAYGAGRDSQCGWIGGAPPPSSGLGDLRHGGKRMVQTAPLSLATVAVPRICSTSRRTRAPSCRLLPACGSKPAPSSRIVIVAMRSSPRGPRTETATARFCGEGVIIAVGDEFGDDDAERGHRIEVEHDRFAVAAERHVVARRGLDLGQIGAERADIGAEIRRAGQFRAEQIVVDLRERGDAVRDRAQPALPGRIGGVAQLFAQHAVDEHIALGKDHDLRKIDVAWHERLEGHAVLQASARIEVVPSADLVPRHVERRRDRLERVSGDDAIKNPPAVRIHEEIRRNDHARPNARGARGGRRWWLAGRSLRSGHEQDGAAAQRLAGGDSVHVHELVNARPSGRCDLLQRFSEAHRVPLEGREVPPQSRERLGGCRPFALGDLDGVRRVAVGGIRPRVHLVRQEKDHWRFPMPQTAHFAHGPLGGQDAADQPEIGPARRFARRIADRPRTQIRRRFLLRGVIRRSHADLAVGMPPKLIEKDDVAAIGIGGKISGIGFVPGHRS